MARPIWIEGDFIRATGGCGAVHDATGAACWLNVDHRCSHEAPRPVPGLSRREQAERELVVWPLVEAPRG